MPAPLPTMPPGLQEAFASSLRRAIPPGGQGDETQATINAAAQDFAAKGLSFMNVWWPLYADKGRLSLRLQYLYTQRECLSYLERKLFEITTNAEDGVSQSDSDIFKAVATMRGQVQADIDALEKQISAGQGAAVGAMVHNQPAAPPVFGPNPNDSRYVGDPLKRSGFRVNG